MTHTNLKSNGKPKPEEVEPIKKKDDIEKIKQYLLTKKNKRDYMLFVIGINVGLRAGDLLSLKWCDVLDDSGKVKNKMDLIEEKTAHTRVNVKKRTIDINKSVKDAIKFYLDSVNSEYNKDGYLFSSQKGDNLTVESLHKIIKNLMKELKIKGNYGTHSLRKTFGYHLYNNKVPLETIQKIFGHSTQSMTLKYIGITREVISDVYNGLCL